MQTEEGINVWKEARNFLTEQRPLPRLQGNKVLQLCSSEHAENLKFMEILGHIDPKGQNFNQRIGQYAKKLKGSLIELIGTDLALEHRISMENIVLGLIIDDGVYNRGHRRAIFNPVYKYLGGTMAQSEGKVISVINMS